MSWTLVIIFGWTVVNGNSWEPAHSGVVVPGFATRQACHVAQELLSPAGSKSACILMETGSAKQ